MTRILLVDHEPHVRSLVRRVLQHTGYEVTDVAHHKHALAWLETSMEPAIVILSTMLLDLQLAQLLQAVSEDRFAQHNVCLLLTAVPEDLPQLVRPLVRSASVFVVGLPFALETFLHAIGQAEQRLAAMKHSSNAQSPDFTTAEETPAPSRSAASDGASDGASDDDAESDPKR